MSNPLSLIAPNAWLNVAAAIVKHTGISKAMLILAIAMSPATAMAASPENAIINFGVPTTGGATNHRIVPDEAVVVEDGIVNFVVSGFHQVTVYRVANNTKLTDIATQIVSGQDYVLIDKAGTTILDTQERSAANPNSIDSNPSGQRIFIETAASATARIVGVYFPEPGTYLVICAIKPHLDDKMIALLTVNNTGND